MGIDIGAKPWGRLVLFTGAALIAGSVLWLVITGNTGLRYTADNDDTVAIWTRWVPVLVGIALVRLVPPAPPANPLTGHANRALRTQAIVLVCTAVLFAVSLPLAGGGEPAHTLLKLPLLLGVPVVMFWWSRRRGTGWSMPNAEPARWRTWGPAIPVVGWLILSNVPPFAAPPSSAADGYDPMTMIVTVLIVFALNALLEEYFYRRWLQTRWEVLLGRWPAIVLAALLWAAWHIGIQGGERLDIDLASVIANQGVQGLFLGYLWSKYRRMWPLLVVHGAMNSVPLLSGLLPP